VPRSRIALSHWNYSFLFGSEFQNWREGELAKPTLNSRGRRAVPAIVHVLSAWDERDGRLFKKEFAARSYKGKYFRYGNPTKLLGCLSHMTIQKSYDSKGLGPENG
jgi:hypothetical protein